MPFTHVHSAGGQIIVMIRNNQFLLHNEISMALDKWANVTTPWQPGGRWWSTKKVGGMISAHLREGGGVKRIEIVGEIFAQLWDRIGLIINRNYCIYTFRSDPC